MKIAYAGAPGAFSHQAALRFRPDYDPLACSTFEDVIAAVADGGADLGILPLANNEAGETGARELISAAPVRIVDQAELRIRMHLLALPGATIDDLRTIASHPIALRQCARTIAELGLPTEGVSNTAVAASNLSNPNRGVIASEEAARIYGLAILRHDVHDRPDNATIFAVIGREEE